MSHIDTPKNNVGILNKLLLPSNVIDTLKNQSSDDSIINLLKKPDDNIKKLLSSNFDSTFFGLKLIFILLFIVMSLVNRHFDFMKGHPMTFGIETLIYGIAGVIPFLYMEKMRKNDNINYTLLFGIFMIYIFFNITLEIGGFYHLVYESHAKHDDKHDDKHEDHKCSEKEVTKTIKHYNGMINSIGITSTLVLVFVVLTLFYMTYKIYDFKIESYGDSYYKFFIIEILIFSLCNSLPFILVAYNRQTPNFNVNTNVLETLFLFLKFVILHVLLQGSGFYNHFFKQ
jgi:hypothetical protein